MSTCKDSQINLRCHRIIETWLGLSDWSTPLLEGSLILCCGASEVSYGEGKACVNFLLPDGLVCSPKSLYFPALLLKPSSCLHSQFCLSPFWHLPRISQPSKTPAVLFNYCYASNHVVLLMSQHWCSSSVWNPLECNWREEIQYPWTVMKKCSALNPFPFPSVHKQLFLKYLAELWIVWQIRPARCQIMHVSACIHVCVPAWMGNQSRTQTNAFCVTPQPGFTRLCIHGTLNKLKWVGEGSWSRDPLLHPSTESDFCFSHHSAHAQSSLLYTLAVGRKPESVSFWKIGMGVFQSSFPLKKNCMGEWYPKAICVHVCRSDCRKMPWLVFFAVFLMHHCF